MSESVDSKSELIAFEQAKLDKLRAELAKEMPIDLRQAQMLAEFGHTEAFMSEFFGVSVSTWRRWKALHPDFKLNLKNWKKAAVTKVERSLYKKATGYVKEKVKITKDGVIVRYDEEVDPETAAAVFFLKNQAKDEWKDTKDISGEINHNHAKVLEDESREKLKKMVEQMQREEDAKYVDLQPEEDYHALL